MREDQEHGDHDEEELDVKLDESGACLPGEGCPCIADIELRTNVWDAAAECAVHWDDGLFLWREEGGLFADERDVGWEEDEEGKNNTASEDWDDSHGEDDPWADLMLLEHLACLGSILMHDADTLEDEAVCTCRQGSWHSKLLPLSTRDDALTHSLVGGHGDDLVCPCAVDASGKDASEDINKDVAEWEDFETEGLAKDPASDADDDDVEDEDWKTSPSGTSTGNAGDVVSGCPKAASDGEAALDDHRLVLAAGVFDQASLNEVLHDLGIFSACLLVGVDFDGGLGCLDHGEVCVNEADNVFDAGRHEDVGQDREDDERDAPSWQLVHVVLHPLWRTMLVVVVVGGFNTAAGERAHEVTSHDCVCGAWASRAQIRSSSMSVSCSPTELLMSRKVLKRRKISNTRLCEVVACLLTEARGDQEPSKAQHTKRLLIAPTNSVQACMG